MDYSASIHETEDPAASPWGNSPTHTPKASRSGVETIGGEAQTSPFRGGFHSQGSSTGVFTQSSESAPLHRTEAQPIKHIVDSETDASQTLSTSEADASPSEAASEPPFHSETREPAQQQQQQPQEHQPPKPTEPQYRLQAKITGLERTGKKDPILRFDVQTNIPRFRTTQFRDVRRLHSEFVKLSEHLISANPAAFVPAVPPPLTSAGAGTDEDEVRVKTLMQRWFNYVCSSSLLMKDDEMVLFVQSDFGYSPLVRMKQPATGVRRKILKQFAPPPDDTPELADARPTVKLFYLGAMDAGHKVDKMVKARRGLGLAESDYGVKLGNMSVQEPHPGLANAYRKLGKVVQTMGDYHAAQATAEATTMSDPFQYHSSDAFIVKESLTNRQILIREYMQAQETTRSKLKAADRLRASSNPRAEKVDEAISALDEARQTETNLHNKTHRVTQNLIQERRKWFSRTAGDLRLSIREYVLRQIEAERRTLALLESVRGDIRSIDGSGGLSRLGREAHPTVRRTSLAASQGPKGDAWSGVPRRSDAAVRTSSSGLANKIPEEEASEEGEVSSAGGGPASNRLAGGNDQDDDDRIDAKNAASRLAASTF